MWSKGYLRSGRKKGRGERKGYREEGGVSGEGKGKGRKGKEKRGGKGKGKESTTRQLSEKKLTNATNQPTTMR